MEWKRDGVWREGGELPPDISHSGGAALRCCDQSQPQNRHVLVSSLSALSLIFISVLKRQDMFFYASRSPPSLTFASSTFTLPHPSAFTPLSSPSLSWVLDGGLSPSKNHYSNFLCNMNDSDPLFILELLITTQPIAYPPRQASHSHSRHYFITRVRLRWASMTAAVIRCGACGGWGPSSQIGAGCISTAASE